MASELDVPFYSINLAKKFEYESNNLRGKSILEEILI